MKKIIKGAVYNTDTSMLVGENGEEKLYRSRASKFFVYSEQWGIRPLTADEAQVWIDNHISPAEGNILISAKIPAATKLKYDLYRSASGKDPSEIVTEALEAYCK